MGTNHVDNSARLCHAASTVAMKRTLGYGATTCSYTDWIGTDLIVFFGSNTPNNQPVTMKYLYTRGSAGRRSRWSTPTSSRGCSATGCRRCRSRALFGTRFADDWFAVDTGGDLAFLNGVLKVLLAEDWVDHAFVAAPHRRASTRRAPPSRRRTWSAGARQRDHARGDAPLRRACCARRSSGIFVWSMGLTQHAHGVRHHPGPGQRGPGAGLGGPREGRPHADPRPLRACRAAPRWAARPALTRRSRGAFEEAWGFPAPGRHGPHRGGDGGRRLPRRARRLLDRGRQLPGDAARPGRGRARARDRVGTRIHQDIVLTSMMLLPPRGRPWSSSRPPRATSRPGGGTETSTERRIIFSPEVRGPAHRLRQARVGGLRRGGRARAAGARGAGPLPASAQAIRDEIAARCRSTPASSGWRARATSSSGAGRGSSRTAASPPPTARRTSRRSRRPSGDAPDGTFYVSTRRGKQFNSMVQHASIR